MLPTLPLSRLMAFWLLLTSFFMNVSATSDRVIEATSLHTCMENSKLTADHFKVSFTPVNSTVQYNLNITAEVSGYVQAYIEVFAYGFKIIDEKFDPCTFHEAGLCPVYPGSNYLSSTYHISDDIVHQIPTIAYTFPDIDAIVIVRVYDNSGIVACIQADLSNRKTVNHIAVKWVTAVIAGIGLLTSAIISTMGNTYTAAHVAANSVALFSYFQSVVIISMCAVQRMPPIASSWAQNIAWSVGLIKITFMQKIFRWYVKATGGTPTQNIFSPTISILVQKRDAMIMQLTNHSKLMLHSLARRYLNQKRANEDGINLPAESTQSLLVLRGIDRVAFEGNIEMTSAVLTAFTFFVLICLAVALCFSLFYLILFSSIKFGWMRKDRFPHFRSNWLVMLKGTILRLLFIAFPSLLIFSLWEFVQRDSAAVIVLAVFFLTLSVAILGWSATKVYLTGKQSTKEHQTPAYLLFSDVHVLNRYGFLYVPYKAFSYYFIIPVLGYIFVKACFVAFAQDSGKTQAVALFVIELAYLVALCYFRPYMDRSTNVINIIIAVVMLINAFLFLFFSQLFGQARAVSSVMGVIFFILNAVFSLVLLLYTIISCTIVLISRNPDSRYKPAVDDRASFIRDQKAMPGEAAELTALGAAARADHDTEFVDNGTNVFEQRYPDSEVSSNYSPEDKLQPMTSKEENLGPNSRNTNASEASSIYSRDTNPFSEKNNSNINNSSLRDLNNNNNSSSPLAGPPMTSASRGNVMDGIDTPGSRDSVTSNNLSATHTDGAGLVTHTYTNASSIMMTGAGGPTNAPASHLRSSSSQSFLTGALGGADSSTGNNSSSNNNSSRRGDERTAEQLEDGSYGVNEDGSSSPTSSGPKKRNKWKLF